MRAKCLKIEAQDDAHGVVEVGARREPVQLDGVARVDPPRVQHATRHARPASRTATLKYFQVK